eukprot:Rhum_TRINITY_DN12687_c0_g1::Rhum_TRINITY_DN12687_c0_g1_i1::g.53097::m.53097
MPSHGRACSSFPSGLLSSRLLLLLPLLLVAHCPSAALSQVVTPLPPRPRPQFSAGPGGLAADTNAPEPAPAGSGSGSGGVEGWRASYTMWTFILGGSVYGGVFFFQFLRWRKEKRKFASELVKGANDGLKITKDVAKAVKLDELARVTRLDALGGMAVGGVTNVYGHVGNSLKGLGTKKNSVSGGELKKGIGVGPAGAAGGAQALSPASYLRKPLLREDGEEDEEDLMPTGFLVPLHNADDGNGTASSLPTAQALAGLSAVPSASCLKGADAAHSADDCVGNASPTLSSVYVETVPDDVTPQQSPMHRVSSAGSFRKGAGRGTTQKMSPMAQPRMSPISAGRGLSFATLS